MADSINTFRTLFQIDVSKYVEMKGQFSYLSWPFAVAQLRLADPAAHWEVRRFDGLPYLNTELGFFVEVAVTVQGVTLSQIHPVSERDKVTRSDTAWKAAAERYLALKTEAEAVACKLDEAKSSLVELAKRPSESGFGVSVTRFWKQGSVDYKRVPELQGVNLEAYRKKGGFETRITIGR